MRHRATLAVLAVATVMCLGGCESPSSPGCGALIGPCAGPAPPPATVPCQAIDFVWWVLPGFDLETPPPAPPVGLVTLGHSKVLQASPRDWHMVCDVASVTWISSDPEVIAFADAVPSGSIPAHSAWLTGVSLGTAVVSAEVLLRTGERVRPPFLAGTPGTPVTTLRVVPAPAPAPGRSVILRGQVELASWHAPDPRTYDVHLPFRVESAGTLDVVVDWGSPVNTVNAHVCSREVLSGGCAPHIAPVYTNQKPLVASGRVSAGVFTLHISNNGPGTESVAYEVGIE